MQMRSSRWSTSIAAVLLSIALLAPLSQGLAERRGVPKFKQKNTNDCGPAAAASALEYWRKKGYAVPGGNADKIYDSIKKAGKTANKGTWSDNLDDAVDSLLSGIPLDGHWPTVTGYADNFDYLDGEWKKGQIIILLLEITDSLGFKREHYVVLDGYEGFSLDVTRRIWWMDPATGEYDSAYVNDDGGRLTFPYLRAKGTAWAKGIYCISPKTKVGSTSGTDAAGNTYITYTVYVPPASDRDSTQHAKDFHITAGDSFGLEGVPPGWKSKVRRVGGQWKADVWDSCKTNGVSNGHKLKLKFKGKKKTDKGKCWVRVTNDGDSIKGERRRDPTTVWHDDAVVVVSLDRPPTPPTWTCVMADPGGGVLMTWGGAADDVEVEGYTLYDHNVSAPDTSIADSFHLFLDDIGPNVLYRYTVMAYDSADNHSASGPGVDFYVDSAGAQPTPSGVNVEVNLFSPICDLTEDDGLKLTFPDVLSPGVTQASFFFGSRTDPPLGTGETQVMKPYYYVSTDAVTTGPGLIVEATYDSAEYVGAEGLPSMYQLVGGVWFDITDYVNPVERTVTGWSPYGLMTDGAAMFALGFEPLPWGDVGVSEFLAPEPKVVPYRSVSPTVVVENVGETRKSFEVVLTIDAVYADTQWVFDMYPGTERHVGFDPFLPDVGASHVLTARTTLFDDINPGNDELVMLMTVLPVGWNEVTSMPLLPASKPVKQGGWLVVDDEGTIYAAKGYKTPDFYSYDPGTDGWTPLRPIGDGTRGPNESYRGGKGVCDGERYIYATLGNNTHWFLRYDIQDDVWLDVERVPSGPDDKNVKGGTDLAYVEQDGIGWAYLLKGYRNEFYKYNTEIDEWFPLPDAPEGIKPKYDKGSWLAYDGKHTIYCHKAKYYDRSAPFLEHEFYRFDVCGDTWYSQPLHGMPLYGWHGGKQRKKKARDGGSAAFYDGQIYALKGGNSQQFWKYFPDEDRWEELETIPTNGSTNKKKRVKYGGDIVSMGDGSFYALKGNKTREKWRYVVSPPYFSGQNALGRRTGQAKLGVVLAPNPLRSGFAVLEYNLPKAGPASVAVFDIAGRVKLRQAVVTGLTGRVDLNLGRLSAGIYLVRFDADGLVFTEKLVLQQ